MIRRSFLPVLLFSLLLVSSVPIPAAAQNATQRPITVDDYFQVLGVSDPQITPDGKWVAYTIDTASLKEDKNESRIWMVPSTGGEAIALTAKGASSSHPRWSPDGKYLAMLSEREGGKTQVWLLNRAGGEAQVLTDTAQGVEDFAWSPDSKRLAVVLRDPSPEDVEAAEAKAKCGNSTDCPEPKKKAGRPWVIDRYLFKVDEVGYLTRRRTHLYVFDLATKKTQQVSSGDFDDANPAWSPDGKRIAFDSNRSMPDPDRVPNADIWVIASDNTDKGANPRQITTNPGMDDHPVWSPDGNWIAYLTQTNPKNYMYEMTQVAVSPAGGGTARILTSKLDRMTSRAHFAADSQSVYFIVDDDGQLNLCQVPVAGGQISRPVSGRLAVNDFAVSPAGGVVVQIATADRPDELFTLVGGTLTRITHMNDDWLAGIKLTSAEYVTFKSKDGTSVSGYVYKPLDYLPGKKYPTLLRPHGGPVWAYYAEFAHLPQLLAANGYLVLYPNYRGSTGYGEEFAHAISADWGHKDYEDDMAMVDYAIAQGWADPEKLGVFGWSYGGISTDFIIAQTQRFKAAISGAGCSLFMSMYGHDQYARDYEYELGRPWEHQALWQKLSFFFRANNITTPTMFMGGDIDWNVPILGGEQMYQALKSLNRETLLVVYPGEYHEFKTPSHLEDRLQRYLAWFAHYVKADGSPSRPADKTGS
jgi:dipeptidyl aminopeptidase/acylaminoacyl peptidase